MFKTLLFNISTIFLITSCSVAKKDYYLIPNLENSASVEVLRKISFIENYIINKPKNFRTISLRTIDEIECLSHIYSPSSGSFLDHKTPTKETVDKWKQWHEDNSAYFRYSKQEEFDTDTYEVILSLGKKDMISLKDKIIVLDNPSLLETRNSKCE